MAFFQQKNIYIYFGAIWAVTLGKKNTKLSLLLPQDKDIAKH